MYTILVVVLYSQLTDSGNRDNSTIGEKINLYNKASGEVLPGLVQRRGEESAMFQGGVPNRAPEQPVRPVPKPQGSFGDAFAAARASHGGAGGTFNWNGKTYTTDYKEEVMKRNQGGGIPDLNDPTNKDTVPAMLTEGEYVLNKEATAMFGPQIEAMNQAGLQQRQAENAAVTQGGGDMKWLKNLEGPSVPPMNSPGIPKYNTGAFVSADALAKQKLEDDYENAWWWQRKGKRGDLYNFNDSIRKLDKMEQRPEPIINENPIPHQKWLSPYMEPRLDPILGNTAVPPGTSQMSDAEAAAFNTFVSESLPKPLQARYAAARRAWNDDPSPENKAAFEAVKKERDAFIAQRNSVGVRGDTPVGSLTDTGIHSAIGGRPEIPVGDLAAGNASKVPVDPRTGVPVGSLTDTSLQSQVAGRPEVPVGSLPKEPVPLGLQDQYNKVRADLNKANKDRDFVKVMELSAQLKALKNQLDSGEGKTRIAGRPEVPVGSVTDTSFHSQIAGKPEAPVGSLPEGSKGQAGGTKTWTAPDGREYYIENGIVVGNVNPEHGQYMPLNIQEQYKDLNTAGGAEKVVNELTNKANLEAEQNQGVVSEETKTELKEAKVRATELRSHEDRIREERAAVAKEYEDKQRAEYEQLKVDNDVLGIKTPSFKQWKKGKVDPEDIAKVEVPTETAVIEGTGLEAAYDEAGLNVPAIEDSGIPKTPDDKKIIEEVTKDDNVTVKEDGSATVKTPDGSKDFTKPQVDGVKSFLGNMLGGLGLDNLDIGELAGQYLLARALGQTHAQAGSRVLQGIQNQKAETKATSSAYKDKFAALSSEGLLSEEAAAEYKIASANNNIVKLEELLANPDSYSEKYKAGVRPGAKTKKLTDGKSTRPIDAYDIGNGQYYVDGVGVVDHNSGWRPHESLDAIREDLRQDLEDFTDTKFVDGRSVKEVLLSEEDIMTSLMSMSNKLRGLGKSDDPRQWITHAKDVLDNMKAKGVDINKQTFEANLYGTMLLGGQVPDISQITKTDNKGNVSNLSSTQLLTFGDNFNNLFDKNAGSFAELGVNNETELLRAFNGGWDPSKQFDRNKSIAGFEQGGKTYPEVTEKKWKNLIKNAPNNYMAYMYWSMYVNGARET